MMYFTLTFQRKIAVKKTKLRLKPRSEFSLTVTPSTNQVVYFGEYFITCTYYLPKMASPVISWLPSTKYTYIVVFLHFG